MGGGSLSVLLYIVYRCSHMCIVCVVCFVCVCVLCVCVCVVLCGMNVCGERCGGVEGVRCVGGEGWMWMVMCYVYIVYGGCVGVCSCIVCLVVCVLCVCLSQQTVQSGRGWEVLWCLLRGHFLYFWSYPEEVEQSKVGPACDV